MVISQQGSVAASQTLASQAGARVLREGGSAVDAAIAANAVLGVVEPMMNGIGGDLFVLHWESKSGKLTGLNASGPAPRGLSPELLEGLGMRAMPETGIHSVTVPGAVRGWAAIHERFGKLPWKSLFASAIAYARDGFPVSEVVQELWSEPSTVGRLRASPEASSVFLPDGRAPVHQGEIFRNARLAHAYERIANLGADDFYTGAITQAILRASQSLGGTMTAGDLASYMPEWVTPISTTYKGWEVFELPPNGQGMAALEMLNIMEASGTATDLHTRIETMKLAYADVYRYNADPRSSDVPVDVLLSKEHARERAARINSARANCAVTAARVPSSDTVYLAVVDREGNIASWIQSIYSSFGSAIAVDGMGFMLQNRGAGFTLDRDHPNVLAGGKRPFHTIIPGFMQCGDRSIGFGIMGGANQPLAHAQFVSNLVDGGMNLQQALEAPRFFKAGSSGCDVAVESRVPERELERLTGLGHVILVRAEYSQEMGRGQAVMHDARTRVNYAASDPRSDGAAIPESI